MKSFLIALSVTLLVPTFAHAKLTVFSNEEAAKLVLNDSAVMEKAKKISKTDSFTSLSVEKQDFNKFQVSLELASENTRCTVSVDVAAVGEKIKLPSGAEIATNKLVVKKVKKELCN